MREKCVCGFSTVDNISLLNIEGTGMIGVPGIAQRLFGNILFFPSITPLPYINEEKH